MSIPGPLSISPGSSCSSCLAIKPASPDAPNIDKVGLSLANCKILLSPIFPRFFVIAERKPVSLDVGLIASTIPLPLVPMNESLRKDVFLGVTSLATLALLAKVDGSNPWEALDALNAFPSIAPAGVVAFEIPPDNAADNAMSLKSKSSPDASCVIPVVAPDINAACCAAD